MVCSEDSCSYSLCSYSYEVTFPVTARILVAATGSLLSDYIVVRESK